jgi:tetratricopeptide (TPR) repeat protein
VIVAAAALTASAAGVEAARERAYPSPEVADDALYLTSGTALRRLTVSMNPLAADLYWIRAVQYYGGARRRLAGDATAVQPPAAPASIADTTAYDQLYPLLDVTTTLDPRFDIAYRFGAIFLAEPYPSGPGRPDLAIALLEKGFRAQPDKWEYMQEIGFVYYWYEHEYRQAADWFNRAAAVPGAPNWLKPLAATTLAAGGDRASARVMWQAILRSADVDWLRVQAERRLLQLQAMDDIDALQNLADRYAEQMGERPHDWNALVRAGLLRQVPGDPTRTAYVLDEKGHVTLSAASPLWPLPEAPLAMSPERR